MADVPSLFDPEKGRQTFEHAFGPKWGPRLYRGTLVILLPLALAAFALMCISQIGNWLPGHKEAAQTPNGGNCNNYGSFTGTMNNNCVNSPPRRPDGLYQADQIIGLVSGAKLDSAQISFKDLRISSGTVDLSTPFEFQSLIVNCHLGSISHGTSANTSIAIVGETVCDVVGRRRD